MRASLALLLLLPFISACTDMHLLATGAAEKRRVMNDMQARATMAAVCDISLGAYLRELNAIERRYAGLVCGDLVVMREALLPEQLAVPARGQGGS